MSLVALVVLSSCESNDDGGDPDDADGTTDTDTDVGDTDDPTTPSDVCTVTLIESFVGTDLNSRTAHVYEGPLVVETTFESGYNVTTEEFLYTSFVVYSYDANDLLVLAELDGPFGIDGVIDSENRYTYNAAAQITLAEYEFFADPTRNSSRTYTYDAAGNLLLEELDAGDDGEVDNSKSYTYDAAGNLETMEEIAGDFTYLFNYNYDALGQLIEVTIDTGVDGSIDTSIVYTYDDAGNQITEVTYDGPEIDRQSTWTYDSSGNKLTWLLEFPYSFLMPQFYTYTYDGEGNLVLSEYDEGNDGDVEQHTEYTYDCPDT